MVVKTWFFTLSKRGRALAKIEKPIYQFKVLGHAQGIRKRSKVVGSVLDYAPCLEHLGEILMGYPYHWIAFAVLEHYVVMRIVFLYEVVLQNQRLVVVSSYDMVYVTDLLDQHSGLAVAIRQEILAHALSKAFGLSNVDDHPVLVLHEVAPRVQRQCMGLGTSLLEVLPTKSYLFLRLGLVQHIAQTSLERFPIHEISYSTRTLHKRHHDNMTTPRR